MCGSVFVVRNPVNAVKKVSPLKTADIHRIQRLKIYFFSPLFTASLIIFFDQTSTMVAQF